MSTNQLFLTDACRRGFFLLFIFILSLTVTIVETIPIKAQDAEDNIIDGIISDAEYQYNATFRDGVFKLFWEVANGEIYLGLVGQTQGWVTLGIDPEKMMKGADMIFGWVNSLGQTEVVDAYSTGETGPHPPDTELGGTNDILVYNGTENSETTIIEVKRYLTTGDEYDKDIPANGTLTIIWAIGNEDDFETGHAERDYGYLNMTRGEVTETDEDIPVEHYLILACSLFGGLFILLVVVDSTGRSAQKKNMEKNENGGDA